MNDTMKVRKTHSKLTSHIICPGSKITKSRRKISCYQGHRPKNCSCYIGVLDLPSVWTELRIRKQLCDGAVKTIDGKIIKIHRAILAASSPYFKALFTNSLHGGNPEKTFTEVDISSEIFEVFLDYAYTGICDVNSIGVEVLLPLADRYEMLGVVQQCCHHLLEEFRPDNCLGIFRFAKEYFCTELYNYGSKYIRHNFKKIVQKSDEFAHLSAQELKEILSDDELNVRNEELVFEAIVKWVDVNRRQRKNFLPSLLHCVRYGLMSASSFFDTVMNHPLILENKILQDSLHSVTQFFTEPCNRNAYHMNTCNTISCPRIPYEILFAIGGWSAGSPTNFVEFYDTRADRWFSSMDTDSTPRAYHGVVAVDHVIYMIGGFNGNDHFNTVRSYNPITHEWKQRACMYHARCYVSVCTLDGKIYALGGYNGRIRMNSAERYTPECNQWEMIPSMKYHRSDASAAALNNKVYVVGGFNGQQVLRSAEVFDPQTNQWTPICSMLSPRSGVSLVAYRNCLYALGGFNGYARLNSGLKPVVRERLAGLGNRKDSWGFLFTNAERECFDMNNRITWTEINDMFSPRSNFATAVLDDMMFVIGGFNGSTTIAHVECYDGDPNEWYDASSMNLNRSALSACVLVGLPNAKEYSYVNREIALREHASSENLSH